MKHSDFSLIPTFVAIVEERSYSGAAKRLGISQSAISQSVAKLKILFNDNLFIRESHGIKPTQFALNIYPELSAAINAIKLTTPEHNKFEPHTNSKQFIISSLSVFGGEILPKLSAAIRQQAPNVSVKTEVRVDDSSLIENLRSQKYDLLLDVDYGQHHQLCATTVMEEELCVVCCNDHPRLTGNTINEQQFLQEKHVAHVSPNQEQAYLLGKGLNADSILRERSIFWYASNLYEMLPIIEQGEYIAIFPVKLAQRYIKYSQIKMLRSDLFKDKLNVSMFWHATRNNDAAHKWFREQVASVMKNH
ncbi:LysR family transcriptional regulator [Vibrio hippocampi]|uniref:HTH-type transcriptional regulator LeuO n=1 Tax=Vibrio hippocampi TaxID=654686 RepID=A0ABN8DNU2_9VIBR|nr:LysR family transcriptional regulator [Vibrio hippocampi]CAH0529598.1 HTH-type transcriptional regulator LeuO [Vibrio hippocampi]